MKPFLPIAASALLATMATAQPPAYKVIDLGKVGGAPGQPFYLAGNGLATGAVIAPDGGVHAVFWSIGLGLKVDIGAPGLRGPNSIAFGMNQKAQIVGEAQTSSADPNGEDFCGFKALGFTSSGSCVPFLWQSSAMTALPTLGGKNGMANSISSQGEIAGAAETGTADPACQAPQIFQFKPVVWQQGKVQALPMYPADSEGIAFAINDSGQVVGASGVCGAFNPVGLSWMQPLHALLWQPSGAVTDLGNLGGTGAFNGIQAFSVNNLGQVVGYSDLAGDTAFHGFLWTVKTGMQDLGTLPGDSFSVAITVNDSGQVVGDSLDSKFNSRAYLWQNGVMTELNTLVPPSTPLFLLDACSINALGEITGFAADKKTGDVHGYVAVPNTSASLL